MTYVMMLSILPINRLYTTKELDLPQVLNRDYDVGINSRIKYLSPRTIWCSHQPHLVAQQGGQPVTVALSALNTHTPISNNTPMRDYTTATTAAATAVACCCGTTSKLPLNKAGGASSSDTDDERELGAKWPSLSPTMVRAGCR